MQYPEGFRRGVILKHYTVRSSREMAELIEELTDGVIFPYKNCFDFDRNAWSRNVSTTFLDTAIENISIFTVIDPLLGDGRSLKKVLFLQKRLYIDIHNYGREVYPEMEAARGALKDVIIDIDAEHTLLRFMGFGPEKAVERFKSLIPTNNPEEIKDEFDRKELIWRFDVMGKGEKYAERIEIPYAAIPGTFGYDPKSKIESYTRYLTSHSETEELRKRLVLYRRLLDKMVYVERVLETMRLQLNKDET